MSQVHWGFILHNIFISTSDQKPTSYCRITHLNPLNKEHTVLKSIKSQQLFIFIQTLTNIALFCFFGFEFWVTLLFQAVEVCSRMSMAVRKMLVCPPPPPPADLCFVIFQDGAYLAMSSVAGTLEVLAFVTVLFVLQIKNQLDWQWRKSFSVVGCTFVWFMPKTDRWCLDLCFVIFKGGKSEAYPATR